MRDIMSAPIFMRLGDRMRGPDNTPVGTLRRVIVSNLVCSNSVSRLGSVISGIPGHIVEDVKISNIQILHQGGGTKEDAAYQPPEYEDMYPEPSMFTGNYRANARTPDGHWIPEGAGRVEALVEAREEAQQRPEHLLAEAQRQGNQLPPPRQAGALRLRSTACRHTDSTFDM
jgi:hypothetical protein